MAKQSFACKSFAGQSWASGNFNGVGVTNAVIHLIHGLLSQTARSGSLSQKSQQGLLSQETRDGSLSEKPRSGKLSQTDRTGELEP